MPSRAKLKNRLKKKLKELKKYKQINLKEIDELEELDVRGDYVWVEKEKEETSKEGKGGSRG